MDKLPFSALDRRLLSLEQCWSLPVLALILGAAVLALSALGTSPQFVRFTQGLGSLTNLSLSDRGLLRWYASCCNTPIANTPRNCKMPYVGLIASCLSDSSPHAPAAFGPIRAVINTQSATGTVAATPLRSFLTIARLMKMVISSRLNGTYRRTPFFSGDTGDPIASPRVLTETERRRAQDGAQC